MTAPPRTPEKPADHPITPPSKVGVLLVNLGTPDALDRKAIRRYLREFLSDRRVIELPRILWLPILYLFVLTFRPRRTLKAYAKIWDHEKDESPIRTHTRDQAERLQARLGDAAHVDWAMRYGNPSIRARLNAMKAAGCDRILLIPLYPQYGAPTTATVVDEAFRALEDMRWQPALRVAPPFFDEPAFVDAIARSLTDAAAKLTWTPDEILLSYHGVPESYLMKGDPYHCHCAVTTRLVQERLPRDLAGKLRMSFQSRFGPEEWLKPYTDETLEELAADGRRNVMVAAPAFVADCVETLEEIAIEGKEAFLESGGENFVYVPCLNAERGMIDVLEAIATRELGGWVAQDVAVTRSRAA